MEVVHQKVVEGQKKDLVDVHEADAFHPVDQGVDRGAFHQDGQGAFLLEGQGVFLLEGEGAFLQEGQEAFLVGACLEVDKGAFLEVGQGAFLGVDQEALVEVDQEACCEGGQVGEGACQEEVQVVELMGECERRVEALVGPRKCYHRPEFPAQT